MLKNSKTKIPYDDIDMEIRPLIKYINNVDGIETTSCCFGHHKEPIMIWLTADSIADLRKFMYDYFYCNDLWEFKMHLTDVDIDDGNWSRIDVLLETSTLVDIKATWLAADNLTKTFFLIQHGFNMAEVYWPDYINKGGYNEQK